MKELKSDQGPPFNGHEFSVYAREKGFIHKRVKPRHLRGNGEAEKFMQNLKKIERIAKQEGKKYRVLVEGMLNGYRATPHPATGKSPFELMFGRKMRLGVLPDISKCDNDREVRKNDAQYKLKSKRYHDKRRNVKKSDIVIGDRILMKNKRTDSLNPIFGKVIKIWGNAVTARFDDGKIFRRDKSHFKILRERSCSWERKKTQENSSFNKNAIEQRRSDEKMQDEMMYQTDRKVNEKRQPVYITRSGREVYLPERFQS